MQSKNSSLILSMKRVRKGVRTDVNTGSKGFGSLNVTVNQNKRDTVACAADDPRPV